MVENKAYVFDCLWFNHILQQLQHLFFRLSFVPEWNMHAWHGRTRRGGGGGGGGGTGDKGGGNKSMSPDHVPRPY